MVPEIRPELELMLKPDGKPLALYSTSLCVNSKPSFWREGESFGPNAANPAVGVGPIRIGERYTGQNPRGKYAEF
jgi:hypothetical protein